MLNGLAAGRVILGLGYVPYVDVCCYQFWFGIHHTFVVDDENSLEKEWVLELDELRIKLFKFLRISDKVEELSS